MRGCVVIFAAVVALGQSTPRTQLSHTTESLRGVSVVSRQIAWASGTHGTYLRTTDGGYIWTPEQVPEAETLDFRAVVAFSADEAFLMSAGPAAQSRIYHTSDTGRHWQLQFTNTNPKGFLDCMVFWDRTHGVALGDPVPDDVGKLKFEVLMTSDGQTWTQVPSSRLPAAVVGEGAFAASNSCLAIWSANSASGDGNIWFATGGKVARVFHSPDRGESWQVFETPIMYGADSTGIFSIAFRDTLRGVIAGGDYKHPDKDGPNLAFTNDGGKSWSLSKIFPQSYYSAVTYDHRRTNPAHPRLFVVGPKFVYDFRPPRNPTRIAEKNVQFHAIAAYPDGGALVVGPKGTIASIP
jgi:photosystem II stability/assembly factor-like uncharacterized protein